MTRRGRRWDRGQAIIEFALIAPLVILFLFTIVDFGIAMDRRITLQHAVREGARMAAVNEDIGQVCDHTVAEAQDIINGADITFSYEDLDDPPNGRATDAGDSVKVGATFDYDLPIVGPVLQGLFGGSAGSIPMTPWGTARLELSVPGETECP
jgi:Flp pilus assembly protein TadG